MLYFQILRSIFNQNVYRLSRRAYWFMVLVEICFILTLMAAFFMWYDYLGIYTLMDSLRNYLGLMQFLGILLGILFAIMGIIRGAMRIRDAGFSAKYYYIGQAICVGLAFADMAGAFNDGTTKVLSILCIGFDVIVFIFTLLPTSESANRFGEQPIFKSSLKGGIITASIALILIFVAISAKPLYARITYIKGCQIESGGKIKNLGMPKYDYKYFGEKAEHSDMVWDFVTHFRKITEIDGLKSGFSTRMMIPPFERLVPKEFSSGILRCYNDSLKDNTKNVEIPLKDYKIHGDVWIDTQVLWIDKPQDALIVPFVEGKIADTSITLARGDEREERVYKDGKLNKIHFSLIDEYSGNTKEWGSYSIDFIDGKPHGVVATSRAQDVYFHGLSFGVLRKDCFVYNGYCIPRMEVQEEKNTYYNKSNTKIPEYEFDIEKPFVAIIYDDSHHIKLVKYYGYRYLESIVYFEGDKPKVLKKLENRGAIGYLFRDDGIEEFMTYAEDGEKQLNNYVREVLGIDMLSYYNWSL